MHETRSTSRYHAAKHSQSPGALLRSRLAKARLRLGEEGSPAQRVPARTDGLPHRECRFEQPSGSAPPPPPSGAAAALANQQPISIHYTTDIGTHLVCCWSSRMPHASDICCCLACPDSLCKICPVPLGHPGRRTQTLLIHEDGMHVSLLLSHNRAAIDFSRLQNLSVRIGCSRAPNRCPSSP